MIGKVLGGRYEVLKNHGAGGMAVVYRARDRLLGRTVAVKVLREQFALDEQFLQSFEREAKAAAALTHPNIVGVYDVGVDDGIHYIVMEMIEGTTLKELIRERGCLSARTTLIIARQIATALAEAHSNNIVHRDIKPQNILMTPDGLVKVTDFGIARAQAFSQGTLSNSDSVIGSVHYVSPEQARGDDATPRSDVYALGVVMYEMLTGKVPFNGGSPVAVVLKHVEETPRPPSQLRPMPPEVEALVLRAMSKDPHDRFVNARAMARAIIEAERELPLTEENDDEGGELATRMVPTLLPEGRRRRTAAHSWQREAWFRPALIGGIVLVLILGGVLATRSILAWINPPEVQVPDVTTMARLDAIAALAAQGLRYKEEAPQYSASPVGTVVKTDPAAETTVRTNREIRIWVSLGPRTGYVPLLISLSEREALLTIVNYGLTVGQITRQYDRVVPEGYVIDQNPRADIPVPEKTPVDVTISKGPTPATLTMPPLKGEHITQALDMIRSLKLAEGTVIERGSESYPIGSVMEQTPAAGTTTVQEGARVDLVISRGTVTPKQYTDRFDIPVTFQGPQQVKVVVFVDAKAARCIYWKNHVPGETVSYSVEWVGASGRIEIYITGAAGSEKYERFLK
ncbi:MAG: Stk1 family PASTA domain-containing Ser/Thr kinase [Bacillota bacterium]|nr:Stk1 family PASTA domain-containing Ser/Thr kinase [Bacillota bacterium]